MHWWPPSSHFQATALILGLTSLRYGYAAADLDRHRVWVCPMFEPFLGWLYGHFNADTEQWYDTLPAVVELPDAPAALQGYRREGRAAGDPGWT